MRKERSYSEVYNDTWDLVVNVFRVLRSDQDAEELERLLRLTPYARTEFNNCSGDFLQCLSDVEKARMVILRSFAGFGSAATDPLYKTGFRGNSNRYGTTPAHDWMNYPNQIQNFTKRLQGVTIENRKYSEIIEPNDTPETLFYADPPYLHETRRIKSSGLAYRYEMTNEDHAAMCEKLKSVKGMAILSGYDNSLYNNSLPDWFKVERKALADGARERKETLWVNPSAAAKLGLDLL